MSSILQPQFRPMLPKKPGEVAPVSGTAPVAATAPTPPPPPPPQQLPQALTPPVGTPPMVQPPDNGMPQPLTPTTPHKSLPKTPTEGVTPFDGIAPVLGSTTPNAPATTPFTPPQRRTFGAKPKQLAPGTTPTGVGQEGQWPTEDGNLRDRVFTPGQDPRLKGAQAATDAAMTDITGANRQTMQGANEDRYRSLLGTGQVNGGDFTVDPKVDFRAINTQVTADAINPNVAGGSVNTQVGKGPAVNAAESARTASYGTAQDQALAGLNGPSRTELAQKTLADFDAKADVARQGQFRKVGQTAAKFGRIGMGDVNAELGSIEGDFQRDRLAKQNELAASVAEGDISDRFRRVDATAGLRGQEAGIDAGMRGEQRIERDYGTGLDERNISRALTDRDYSTGLAERNQGRAVDERGFQTGLAADNIGRATNERNLESALAERNVGRQQQERDTSLGIATGNQDRGFARNQAAINAATAQTDRGIGDTYDQFNAANTLEDRVFGQGQSNRSEYRTERANQNADAQRTIDNALKERELVQQEEEMRLRRAAAQSQAGGR